MQSSQSDISFIKDVYLNIQTVIRITSRILESSIEAKKEAQKDFPTNLRAKKNITSDTQRIDTLVEHYKTLFKHELLVELDKIEILILDLQKQLKGCPKKKSLILGIKSFLFGLNENNYEFILDTFLSETDEIRTNNLILSSNWDKLLELNVIDIAHLKIILFSNTKPQFYDYSKGYLYYDLLSILLPVIQYLEDIEVILNTHFIKFLENSLIKKSQPKTFNYIQDVTKFLPNFFEEMQKIFTPARNGSFKSIFGIVAEQKHYVSCSFKSNSRLQAISNDLPAIFEEEILLNIFNLNYDNTKKDYYMTFLANKLEGYFTTIDDLINRNIENNMPFESIKGLLKHDFYDLEPSPFFRKIATVRQPLNEEDNLYNRELTDEEKNVCENIFDTYFNDWSLQLKQYLTLYEGIIRVYLKYVNPESLEKRQKLESKQENSDSNVAVNQFYWNGEKVDLQELVFTLYQTQNIKSSKTNNPATKTELYKYFSTILNQDITKEVLASKKNQINKKGNSKHSYTQELADIFENYLKK